MPMPGIEDKIDDNAEAMLSVLRRWTLPGTLPNFTSHAENLPRCYDPHTIARLAAAVRTYDPDGVLAFGHVIRVERLN